MTEPTEMAPIVSPGDPGYVPPTTIPGEPIKGISTPSMEDLLAQVAAALEAPPQTTTNPMHVGMAATGVGGAAAIVVMGVAAHFGVPMDINFAMALVTLVNAGLIWVAHRGLGRAAK